MSTMADLAIAYHRLGYRIHPDRWSHAPEDPLAIVPAHSLPVIGPEALLAFAPKAPRPDSESRRALGRNEPLSASVREQLLDACEAKGLRVRRLAPGTWAIECPWRDEHSNGAQTETDTVILDRAPWFKCLHSHCAGRGLADLTAVLGVAATVAPMSAVPAPAKPAPKYPDRWNIAGFFFNCLPTGQDADCRRWLSDRGLSSDIVDERDLAFALGPGALPRWASCAGHSWREAGYRMALPLWSPVPDAADRLHVVSAMARHVAATPQEVQVVTAAGHTRRGLVLSTGSDYLADGRARRLVTVCSGPDDFLALAHWPASARGSLIGSFPRSPLGDAVDLIPEGWTVALAMPTTMAGDDEARQWTRRLVLRGCRVVRCPLRTGRWQ